MSKAILKRSIAFLLMMMLCMGCFALAGCGSKSEEGKQNEGETEESADQAEAAEEDWLLGTWFAKESSYEGETKDPEEVFGGTFYLYFDEDGECTMAIDQKRAVVKWERTGDGVTLTGDDTYQITFPDDTRRNLIITIKGIDTLCEKYESEK